MKGKVVEIIIDTLQKTLLPSTIYIFGSYAKGSDGVDSDMDIAYLSEKHLDHYERFMLAQELADKLGKEVDLVDLKQATTVFRAQIIGTGTVIYCSNHAVRMNFEMLTLKMYAKLNEERKVILDEILESGEVYEVRRDNQ